MEVSKEIKEFLKTAEPRELKYFFSIEAAKGNREEWVKRVLLLDRFFFGELIEFDFADFHHKWIDFWWDVFHTEQGTLYVSKVTSRELQKTAMDKFMIAYAAWYELETSIIWLGADFQKNKTDIASIASMVKSDNAKKLFGDFTPRQEDEDTATAKMFGNDDKTKRLYLTTYTGEKIKRGITHKYTNKKPEVMLFDDYETVKTLASQATTRRYWENMTTDGIQSMSQRRRIIIWNANYLSNKHNTQKVINATDKKYLSIVPLYDENEKILWTEKYCWTDQEALETNKISIDSIKRNCKKLESEGAGYNIFEREYLCRPTSKEKLYHNIDLIEQHAEWLDPLETTIEGFNRYFNYDKERYYIAGFDLSGGVGRDASAFVIGSQTIQGAREEATFVNKTMKQDELAEYFLKIAKEQYDNKLFLVLDGDYGMGFNPIIQKRYPKELLYLRKKAEETDKIIAPMGNEYGTRTNTTNKEMFATRFKSAVENGELVLHSQAIKEIVENYTNDDHITNRRLTVDPIEEVVGAHWDLLDAERKMLFGMQERVISKPIVNQKVRKVQQTGVIDYKKKFL